MTPATISTSVAQTAQALEGVSDAPRQESVWLHTEVLGFHTEASLITRSREQLPRPATVRLAEFIARRQSGEPLAYVLGEWEFFGRRFTVTPDVLVPRPATEALVEAAAVAVADLAQSLRRPVRLADIGTGSGCVAITLVLEVPPDTVRVIGSDVSAAALAVARENASRHGAADRIEWREGSLLEPYTADEIDMIVSNPPYVPTVELKQAGERPETRGLLFEPAIALDGGPDGRQYVKALADSGIPTVVESVGGVIETFNIAVMPAPEPVSRTQKMDPGSSPG